MTADNISDKELALNHFMQGEFLMNQGNYALAILEFQDAIELAKDYKTDVVVNGKVAWLYSDCAEK